MSESDTDGNRIRESSSGAKPTRATFDLGSALERLSVGMHVLTAEMKCRQADYHQLRGEVF